MTNIVIVDIFLQLFPFILKDVNNINIVAYIVESEEQKNQVQSYNPEMHVYTCTEILNWDKTYVSQFDIQKFRSTQLKVERGFSRLVAPNGNNTSMYYCSLAFWLELYKERIDDIFIWGHVEHGYHVDSIPIDVAKHFGIPAYLIENVCAKPNYELYAIKDCNSNCYINLQSLFPQYKGMNIKEFFSPSKNKSLVIPLDDSLIDKNLQNRSFLRRLKDFYKYHIRLGKNLDTVGLSQTIGVYDQILFRINLSRLRRYYNKYSVSSVQENDKVILYALHFEPEAQYLNRTIYDSQIYNIKMLSKSLPEGWKIYVKEHPMTFKLSVKNGIQYIKTFTNYKNIDYYRELLLIPNVYLLNWEYPVVKLISSEMRQIKAIATINGTIALEAMFSKKPVILFDQATNPYAEIHDLLNVTCLDDLDKIFELLLSDSFCTEYAGFEEILSKYLIIKEEASKIFRKFELFNVIINLHEDVS